MRPIQMMQIPDNEVERAKSLLSSIRHLLRERRTMEAAHKINAVNDIMLNAKKVEDAAEKTA